MKIKTMAFRCIIAERGLTPTSLAELAGLSRNTVSCVINGKTCSFSTAAKLAKALNVSLEEIAEE